MNVNYGIVGSGYFGAQEARALQKIPGATVRGIYDPHNAHKPAR